MTKQKTYGHDQTIHRTNHIDVEVGPDGKVCALWFRCSTLPFKVTHVDAERAKEMSRLDPSTQRLVAVVFEMD